MKTLVNRLGLLMVGTLVLGGAAFGQTLKVNVPFAFRVGASQLPAGHYTVIQKDDSMQLTNLRNDATGRSFLSQTNPTDNTQRGTPQLTFLCGGGSCSLREIRTARGASTYPPSRKASHEAQTAAVVSLPLTAQGE